MDPNTDWWYQIESGPGLKHKSNIWPREKGTLMINEVCLPSHPQQLYIVTSKMTAAQQNTFELLNISDKVKVFTVN